MTEKKEIIKEFPLGTPPDEKIKATEGYIRKQVIVYPDKIVYVLEKEEKKEEKKEEEVTETKTETKTRRTRRKQPSSPS